LKRGKDKTFDERLRNCSNSCCISGIKVCNDWS